MWWKYLVFYVLLLKSISDNVSVLKQVFDNYLIKQEDWYKAKKILIYKDISKQKHYLVKWKDCFNFKNIWELEDNLNKYLKTIEKYLCKEYS